jgi:hypothetical protein
MSTLTLPDAIEQRPASSMPWMRHSLTLAGRSVKKMMRHPEQFFDVTLQPVLFLLIFVYVLGGAIAGSTHEYLQFVLPGILIQTVLFSTISIGVNLNTASRSASACSPASSSATGPARRSSRCWPRACSSWSSPGACAGSRSGSA